MLLVDDEVLALKRLDRHLKPLSKSKTSAGAVTEARIQAPSHISMEFGITGPSFTISTACSSAAHAIGQAYWMVRSGVTDLALSGGSEAPFSLGILKAWEAMRVVSPETCRPFSKDRRGMILGEGAAMLVLEPLEIAQARGARIHAEIVGVGMSADACHITQWLSIGNYRPRKQISTGIGLHFRRHQFDCCESLRPRFWCQRLLRTGRQVEVKRRRGS